MTPRKPSKCEVESRAHLLREAQNAILDVTKRGVYYLIITVRRTVADENCGRSYDDDEPHCIDCKHYALCDAAAPFAWIVDDTPEEDRPVEAPTTPKTASKKIRRKARKS